MSDALKPIGSDIPLANEGGRSETNGLYAASGEGFIALYNSRSDLMLRRFDAAGDAIGEPVDLLPAESASGGASNIATDILTLPDGEGYIVTMQSSGARFGTPQFRFMFLDAEGNPVGEPVEIVRGDGLQATSVRIEAVADGFAVAWADAPFVSGSPLDFKIGARVYNSDGTPRTDVLDLVNPDGDVTFVDIAPAADGGFVVAYVDRTGGFPGSVTVESFDAAGAPAGGPAIVEAGTADAFARLAGGGFALAQVSSEGSIGGPTETVLSVRIVEQDGTTTVSETEVERIELSPFGGDGLGLPRLIALSDGGFLVIYNRELSGGDADGEVVARQFSALGEPVGEAFVVNAEAAGNQFQAGAAQLADGTVVVGWHNVSPSPIELDVLFRLLSDEVKSPTDGDDELIGTPGDDTIDGLAGNDTIVGLAGFDTLIGGEGNDMLDGGANPDGQGDFLLGGPGDDTYHVDHGLDFVDEGVVFPAFGFGGNDTIVSTADFYWDFYSIAEVLRVSEDVVDPEGDGATIVAGIFDNELIGHSGTDVLFGRGGSDTYRAGDGVDFISLSTLGVTDENAYEGVDGANTVVVEARTSGTFSYDIVFEFESGKDRLDVSAYGFASAADAFATGVNVDFNGDGDFDDADDSSYFVLGDGLDYLYMVGTTLGEMTADDFIV